MEQILKKFKGLLVLVHCSAKLGPSSRVGVGGFLNLYMFRVLVPVVQVDLSTNALAPKEGPSNFACKSKSVDRQDWYIFVDSSAVTTLTN